jgi:hypothetical protein
MMRMKNELQLLTKVGFLIHVIHEVAWWSCMPPKPFDVISSCKSRCPFCSAVLQVFSVLCKIYTGYRVDIGWI